MPRTIQISERDRQALERLQKFAPAASKNQPQSYRERVVVKPWGYEFLMFENAHAAVWFLHIGYGHSTSMHCHPRKKTSLIVVSGSAFCNTFSSRNFLDAVNGVMIDKGVFHFTKCLSKGGLDLIEVETPPNKTDLVRLNDSYGRETSGYEGMSEMKEQSLERYGYFYFEDGPCASARSVERGGVEISLECFRSGLLPGTVADATGADLYCSLGGEICDAGGARILGCGDLAAPEELGANAGLAAGGVLSLLRIKRK